MAIPFTKYTFTDSVANDVTAARLNAIGDGIVQAQQMPAARVTHNAAQGTTTAVDFVLAFNTERFDQMGGGADTMHDTVTNNSRLTCRYAGIYLISGNIQFASNATGTRYVKIRLNGTTEIARVQLVAAASDTHTLHVSCLYSLAVNDYVELLALQSSGGNLNVNSAANYSPEFSAVRVA